MKEPFISVITPTYNRAHTILNAIKTVQSQTFKNWEMIIVDDGSTDDTREKIKALNDPKIHYYKKQNGGPSRARNYGIERAKGEWIMYLDSDDELLPKCMGVMLEWLNKYPQAVFAFPRSTRTLELYEDGRRTKVVDDSGDTPETFTLKDIFNRNAGFSPNGFMHLRRLFDEGIMWDDDLRCMEDWELMMSIGEKYPQGFLYVPVVLQKYTQRFGSDNLVSQANYGTWADGFEYIYNKHKNDKMLKGQTWFPKKANKWRQRQREFEAGKRPAYQYHYFQ